LFRKRGDYAKAKSFFDEALNLKRKLYPESQYAAGHPDLALGLQNVAWCLFEQGELAKAESLCREALRMCTRLYPARTYPAGHPALARCLLNLGALYLKVAEYKKAEPYCRDGLAMCYQLAVRFADTSSEAEALNYLASLPHAKDLYLSAACLRNQIPADYQLIWHWKGSLSRIIERRHRDVLVRQDPQMHALAKDLLRTEGTPYRYCGRRRRSTLMIFGSISC
jgi:tetratricopeptide (TPR) repeat protein